MKKRIQSKRASKGGFWYLTRYFSLSIVIIFGLFSIIATGGGGGGGEGAGGGAGNTPPVADAGTDQGVIPNTTVQLDGSGSSDADGDALTFNWVLASMPEDSSAELSDATAEKPTFLADRVGQYRLTLVVNDGKTDSELDTVVVNAQLIVLTSNYILPTAGGLLLVTSDDDELNGASLDIPARAVSEAETVSIGTVDSVPSDSPFGQSPIGKLFGLEPSGLIFAEDEAEEEEAEKKGVILTLPIPPGEADTALYIGCWDETTKTWENLGGTVSGSFISTAIDHLSIFGLFYGGKSYVKVELQAPEADLGVELLYVSGPALPPDHDPGIPYPSYRPLPAGGVEVKQDEPAFMKLLPGRYHFLVSYPHPQPGRANSLFFTIPELTDGADDGQIDQTITITMVGASSTDAYTNDSISFPGYQATPGSNLRPVIAATATVREDVVNAAAIAVVDRITGNAPIFNPQDPGATRLVNIGPVKIEQLDPTAISLIGTAHDPEGALLYYYWTWEPGTLPSVDQVASDGSKTRYFYPNPIRARVYTVSLTVYDQYGLFDQCTWFIDVRANNKPTITNVPEFFVINFGRLDRNRRLFAPQPTVDLLPFSGSAGAPPIEAPPWPITTLPFGNLCAPPTPSYLQTLPNIAVAGGDMRNPAQYVNGLTPGATCLCATVFDADGDPLAAGFSIPEPIMGRGTLYAAIPVPDKDNGGAGIPLLDDPPRDPPRMVAHILPGGLVGGSIIDTYAKMDAYNATLSYLANADALFQPGTPPPPPGSTRPQLLPVIWEAPDDPDSPSDTTHDCVTWVNGDFCKIRHGGTVNIKGWVTDRYSPDRIAFATVAYPALAVVFPPGNFAFTATPNPANPAPWQGVTITVVLTPPTAGVTVNFSIVGTDGYSNAASPTTGEDGVATFWIPGAKEGVVDVVTVRVGNNSATITYVF